jgi:hypothetical protein
LLTVDLSQLLKDAALRTNPTVAPKALRLIRVIRSVLYLALGAAAVILGMVLFGIALYQSVRYPALRINRLKPMAEFACAVYVGYCGVRQGLKLRRVTHP